MLKPNIVKCAVIENQKAAERNNISVIHEREPVLHSEGCLQKFPTQKGFH